MVLYRETEWNNNTPLNFLVKYVKKYTRYVPIKMLSVTKSLYLDKIATKTRDPGYFAEKRNNIL